MASYIGPYRNPDALATVQELDLKIEKLLRELQSDYNVISN